MSADRDWSGDKVDSISAAKKLQYPNMKADIELCYEQLFEPCKGEHIKSVMSIPHMEKDFDMQFSAAFDELQAYRDTGLSPEYAAELSGNEFASAYWVKIVDELRDKLADNEKIVARLEAFKAYWSGLYDTNLEIANWHLNGTTEPFDNFYDSAEEAEAAII